MLVDTAEVNNPKSLEMHKSDLELWRLLVYNFDLASTFDVISVFESIRNVQESMSKLNAQEHCKHSGCIKGSRVLENEQAWHQRLPRSVQESRLGEGAS